MMRPSSKLASYLFLGGAALVAALALGSPALVALAAPFLISCMLALARAPRAALEARLSLSPERILEGQRAQARLQLAAVAPGDWIQLSLDLPAELQEACAAPLLAMDAGERRTVCLDLEAERWGAHRVDSLEINCSDRYGLLEAALVRRVEQVLRVYPKPEAIRSALLAARTQPRAGDQRARARGDGFEFAGLRPFVPGDQVRSINWRATARRGSPWVSERHAERNRDVILFLDTFAEARSPSGGTLDLALRAAAAFAGLHLARRDRVGMVGFGGLLQWLTPGLGVAQTYRIADTLIESELVFSYVAKDVTVVPRRVLPPHALVIALTPLLDERTIGALLDLRGRGHDLALVELSPDPFLPVPRTESDRLTRRVWALKQESLRARYRRAGVAVSVWDPGHPVERAAWEVNSFRRRTRQPVSA